MSQTEFPCGQCGAKLTFKPGETALVCQYCGHSNPIEADTAPVEELDFDGYQASLEEASKTAVTEEITTVKCSGCGAQSTFDKNITSDECAFCGSPIVAAQSKQKIIQPKALLPFKVTRQQGADAFKDWLKKLWFAPNALKKRAKQQQKLQGIYVPYWTYDCKTVSPYRGQRGTYYYVTQTYTTTQNGRSVTKTRQVRKIRWRSVGGVVRNTFDDVLVIASQALPTKYAEKLEPWDLNNLVPYKDEYLSGLKTQTYQVNLATGFGIAKTKMKPTIEQTIRADIGGDEQRITKVDTAYNDVTFKHILLPIWISAYKYKEKVFRFLVNARTCEVQGERPWSWVKITLAVLAGLAVIGGIVAIIYAKQNS